MRLHVIFLTIILAAVLVAACQEREPQDIAFEMALQGGELVEGEETLTVYQHDTVTIDWTSYAPLLIHLHGYNIEADMTPGVTSTMEFVADATGRFDIYVHAMASDLENAGGGGSDMTGMQGMDSDDSMDSGSMDSDTSMDHSQHSSMNGMTDGEGATEYRIATLEVRP